jgi:hypothetical protein
LRLASIRRRSSYYFAASEQRTSSICRASTIALAFRFPITGLSVCVFSSSAIRVFQRRNTVMIRAPKRFLDQVRWLEFSELDQASQAYLHQLTMGVIREEVFADASEAPEISEALPPNNGTVFEAAHTVQRRRVDRSKNSTCTIWRASADSYRPSRSNTSPSKLSRKPIPRF